MPVDSQATLHEIGLGLIRSLLPAPNGVRLVGVTLSSLVTTQSDPATELALDSGATA
jgi:hypothetical protein